MLAGLAMYNEMNSDARPLDDIIVRYAPMVKRIGQHLLRRLPNSIQLEDLVQAGMIGLIEAVKNYDASKGASFETYAGIRIRGTMLDEVRRGDWVPRSVHRNARMISDKIRAIEHRTGRDARDYEVAQALEISVADYHQMLVDSSSCHLFALDDLVVNRENLSEGHALTSASSEPYARACTDSLKELLASLLKTLPKREQLVLALYYDEELNLKEIGEVMGVSESRISQIHSQAMIRLQARAANKDT